MVEVVPVLLLQQVDNYATMSKTESLAIMRLGNSI